MKYIGLGFFSKYYFYIIVVFICQSICDFFTGFNQYMGRSSNGGEGIFGITSLFGKHFLINNLLTFITYFLSCIVLHYFYIKYEKDKEGELTFEKYTILKNEYLGEKLESFKGSIIVIGICISFSIIVFMFLGSLSLDSSVWTLEMLFIFFMSYKIFKIHIGKHHLISIIVLVVLFIMDIICSSIPRTKHND